MTMDGRVRHRFAVGRMASLLMIFVPSYGSAGQEISVQERTGSGVWAGGVGWAAGPAERGYVWSAAAEKIQVRRFLSIHWPRP